MLFATGERTQGHLVPIANGTKFLLMCKIFAQKDLRIVSEKIISDLFYQKFGLG